MRFVHTSDLHLGRRLGQMPLGDDTAHMLDQLAAVVLSSGSEAVVVAGDVFDSPVPPEAAVRQWDGFVSRLASDKVPCLVIAGNHDSGARLAFGHELMARAGLHLAGSLSGEVSHVRLGHGDDAATFWLVPFVRPADVRPWAQAEGIEAPSVATFEEALRVVLDAVRSHPAFAEGANVLVSHQFVTVSGAGPARSDSERLTLGTVDNVDASVYEGFDYVALGHIHRPQRVGSDRMRYAGSPLKLSASEARYAKSFVVVDVGARGVSARLEPVVPLHDFREIRGSVDDLVRQGSDEPEPVRQDFVSATVTDDDAIDVASRLRRVWPNLAQVSFDNARTRAEGARSVETLEQAAEDLPQLFGEFFACQAGRELNDAERALALEALGRAGGDAA